LKGNGAGEEGHKRILLELVVEDGNSAFAFGADALSNLRVLQGGVDSTLGATEREGSDAHTAGEQTLGSLEESLGVSLDVTDKLTFGSHVGVLVHVILTGNSHVIERYGGVVDSVEAELDSHIGDGDSRHGSHEHVFDLHNESLDTFILAFDDGLTEDQSVVGVLESVGDPVLLTLDGG